jgi:hypothetical protein
MLRGMKRAVVLLGLLAACKADGGGGDDYGVQPGPGRSPIGTQSPPGNGPVDGGLGDATFDGGVALTVDLCVLADLRQFGSATPTSGCGAAPDKVRVFAGNRPATRGSDGKYTVFAPQGPFTWRVETPTNDTQLLVTTLIAADANPKPLLPVVLRQDYQDVLGGSGVQGNIDDLGAVFIRVLDLGNPLTGTTATNNASTQGALYDDNRSAITWSQNVTGTGAKSIVWFADFATAGQASITLTPPVTATKLSPKAFPASVELGAITFVTAEFE